MLVVKIEESNLSFWIIDKFCKSKNLIEITTELNKNKIIEFLGIINFLEKEEKIMQAAIIIEKKNSILNDICNLIKNYLKIEPIIIQKDNQKINSNLNFQIKPHLMLEIEFILNSEKNFIYINHGLNLITICLIINSKIEDINYIKINNQNYNYSNINVEEIINLKSAKSEEDAEIIGSFWNEVATIDKIIENFKLKAKNKNIKVVASINQNQYLERIKYCKNIEIIKENILNKAIINNLKD